MLRPHFLTNRCDERVDALTPYQRTEQDATPPSPGRSSHEILLHWLFMHHHIQTYSHRYLPQMEAIYRDSIRELACDYYTSEQIEVWSSVFDEEVDFQGWVERAITFVAVTGQSRCMGFSGIERSGHIASLFVSPEWARRGVGSQLLRRVLEEANSMGCTRLSVDASELSRPLFEKYGFHLLGVEHKTIKGVDLSRYKMAFF